MVIGFESGYFLVEQHVIEAVRVTIRLLQPQSHVAPLRNLILIQSQPPLDSYSLNHMSRDWGCKSLMVIGFESGWYFLVEQHVIEAVRV
jgi:hypothetical protein